MKIEVYNRQKDLKIEKKSVKDLVKGFLRFYRIKTQLVEISFVSLSEISDLHDRFFKDPSPTDCITLPMDPIINQEAMVLGQIFICPFVALEYAKEHQTDGYEETSLYLVHGLLHLLGYDDMEEKEKRKMRKQEKICMDWIKEQNVLLKGFLQ